MPWLFPHFHIRVKKTVISLGDTNLWTIKTLSAKNPPAVG